MRRTDSMLPWWCRILTAALSLFNTGRVRRNGYADSQLATVQERLAKAAEARQQWVETGQVVYPPKQAIPTEEQLKAMPFDLYREGRYPPRYTL